MNGLCLINSGDPRLIRYYDNFPRKVRDVLKENKYDLCPACLDKFSYNFNIDLLSLIVMLNDMIDHNIDDYTIYRTISEHSHRNYYDRRAAERYGYGDTFKSWTQMGKKGGMWL